MNKLVNMIANGEITVEELAAAKNIIEQAELVSKGIEACKKTIAFPLGTDTLQCYCYTDAAGEYSAWAQLEKNGMIIFFSNWGGNHETGHFNLLSFRETFLAFDNEDLANDLKDFLLKQIEKAEKAEKE